MKASTRKRKEQELARAHEQRKFRELLDIVMSVADGELRPVLYWFASHVGGLHHDIEVLRAQVNTLANKVKTTKRKVNR